MTALPEEAVTEPGLAPISAQLLPNLQYMISHYPKQLQVHCKNRRKNYGRQIVHFAVLTCRPHFYRLVVYRLTFPAYNSKREILQNSAVRVPHQIEAQRSGFDLERRGKGAERSFKAAPKRDRLETEWSGFRPDVVRVWGVEPQRLTAREPKSRMSTNSIIPADADLLYRRTEHL